MKKIGRNQKCPCGSVVKYKYCCLNDKSKTEETNFLAPSIYQLITFKYLEENHIDLDEELKLYESQLFDSLVDLGKSPSDLLKEYILNAEKSIEHIASKHTTYEMLFWSRRLGPKNIFNVAEISVMLYREVQTLSIYKYGINDENILKDENLTIFPQSIEEYNRLEYSECLEKLKNENLPEYISDVISDVIRVEILSYLYVRGTQLYRIANKGGGVIFDKASKKIISNTNEEVGFLIDIYDERLNKLNLFSSTGAYVNTKTQLEEPYFCPHFQLNVDHKDKIKFFNPKNEAYSKVFPKGDQIIDAKTNYVFGALNIINLYEFLNLFEEEFQNHYSFSVKDFVLFLGYLGLKVVRDFSASFDSQFHIFNRAYIIAHYNLKSFGEDFEGVYADLHKAIFKTEIDYNIDIEVILKRFLLTRDNKNDLDLWTRGPKRFLYQVSDDHMVVDYTCLTDIISYIVKEITSVDGEVGNTRADHFEETLKEEIESIYGKEKMWLCRKEITSGKLKKEIDASFFIGNVLFLIEAKAVNVSFGFDKGDKRAIDFRTKKMKRAITEVNEKAEFIYNNLRNLDTQLPDNIKFICPIVLSANSEYIWSTDEELFISKELMLPRIITIPDLSTIKELDLKDITKNNWIIEL